MVLWRLEEEIKCVNKLEPTCNRHSSSHRYIIYISRTCCLEQPLPNRLISITDSISKRKRPCLRPMTTNTSRLLVRLFSFEPPIVTCPSSVYCLLTAVAHRYCSIGRDVYSIRLYTTQPSHTHVLTRDTEHWQYARILQHTGRHTYNF